MKRLGRISVCLAVSLALNGGLRAAIPASASHPAPSPAVASHPAPAINPASAINPSSENPYATVAVRNIFGLNPPVAPPDPSLDAEKNLPKITPTGIMSVFGYTQVLFKVAAAAGAVAKAGQPAKEEFYILSQGQRQDDIEVIKIDEKNSLVTFDNHGTTQELPLASTSSSGTSAASPSPVAGNSGMTPRPSGGGGNGGAGGFPTFGSGAGVNNGGTPNSNPASNNGGQNAANGGMNFGISTKGRTYQPEASTLTKDESTILIEVERAKLMNDPNPPYTPALLPPTELTKFNTPDGNENPAP